MIFWSHYKCMTTEPGHLPKNYEDLDHDHLPDEIRTTLKNVKTNLLEEEEERKLKEEQDAKDPEKIK
jgi:hypothetical protein